MNPLTIEFEGFKNEVIELKRIESPNGISITIPFYEFNFLPNEDEIKIAKEVIIRLRGRRVLNSRECCDNCIERALESISKIRYELVELQVKLSDLESPLFLLLDFAIHGIKRFLTYTEYYKPRENMQKYFEALAVIRGHLLRTITEIAKIGSVEVDFGFRYDSSEEWEEKIYKTE